MSAREWKPGDVALVEGDVCMYLPERMWEHGDPKRFRHPHDAEARPLVVIDPEDAAQVKRFADCYARPQGLDVAGPAITSAMRVALREFANPTPPKPDEPMGKYAVVEDDKGVEWVRIDPFGYAWQELGQRGFFRVKYATWDDINAARILSEGVPS